MIRDSLQDTWGQPLNVVQMGFSDLSDFVRAAADSGLVAVERAERAGRASGHKVIRLKQGAEGKGCDYMTLYRSSRPV